MARRISEIFRRNVITAFIVVALPTIMALAVLGYALAKGDGRVMGYGFSAIIVALIVQYPYLKICDRYFFK
jgi:hypothetical protein